jgi:methylenetetrahydrofolate reductase (NADPH)
MFIGAAANPFADPFELLVARLAKKVAAGADFVQTQCIYNIDKFKQWMEGVRKRGLHEKCAILAGVTPMKSAGMARYMKNKVPGMDVPQELVDRMAAVPKEGQAE